MKRIHIEISPAKIGDVYVALDALDRALQAAHHDNIGRVKCPHHRNQYKHTRLPEQLR